MIYFLFKMEAIHVKTSLIFKAIRDHFNEKTKC